METLQKRLFIRGLKTGEGDEDFESRVQPMDDGRVGEFDLYIRGPTRSECHKWLDGERMYLPDGIEPLTFFCADGGGPR